MLGLLINEEEHKEMKYLVKRELEELLFDLGDSRIDQVVKEAMEERYQTLFQLLRRIGTEKECMVYIPKHSKHK